MTSPVSAELYPRYVSQSSTPLLGLTTLNASGQPADVDSNAVTASVVDSANVLVLSRAATHVGTGQYGITLTSTETANLGYFQLTFTYTQSSVPHSYGFAYNVGPASPAYDSLPAGFKQIVEAVWVRFADLYDSPMGGPYLQTFFQTRFNRDRIAQLLSSAIGRLNTISQPYMTYSVTSDFPFSQWGPLLEQALYVEIVKHLIRSYVEQPEVALSSGISRLDRRDYMQRWQVVYQMEAEDLELQLETFKIANMGLGNSAVLVSGGAYGEWLGPGAVPGGYGEAAARGYFPYAAF